MNSAFIHSLSGVAARRRIERLARASLRSATTDSHDVMKRRVSIAAASSAPVSPTFDIFLRSIFTRMLLDLPSPRLSVCFAQGHLFVRASLPRRPSNDAYISRAFIATFLRDLLQQFHANFARVRARTRERRG